jgi:hypothetical protein
MDTLHEDLCTFMIISRSFLLRIEIFRTQILQKTKTHILCSVTFFPLKSCLLGENVESYGRARQATDDNITRHMCIVRWIPMATDTHSEYVTFIAFR